MTDARKAGRTGRVAWAAGAALLALTGACSSGASGSAATSPSGAPQSAAPPQSAATSQSAGPSQSAASSESAGPGPGPGAAAGASSPSTAPSPTGTATPGTAPTGPAVALQNAYEQVIAQVLPSVVEITTPDGLGSGVVFDGSGDIVTNNHVVGTARRFQVRFPTSAAPVAATLVGTYPPDDLAVIRVTGVRDLHPAVFAPSGSVQVGSVVLAMGNPLGLSASVTDGIVSALGRTVTEPADASSPGATLPDTIQTSAAINPGNSGGALVDLAGQVIGIPTLAATSGQEGGAAPGIGFAVSANRVRLVVPQLIGQGHVTRSGRAALGVSAVPVTGADGSPAGAGIRSVTAGGAAARAGIRAGDVIVSVAGHPVAGTADLATALAGLDVGSRVPVTVVRGGARQTVQVTLGQLGG